MISKSPTWPLTMAHRQPSKRTADPALVEQGERLYRGGDLDKGISACTACHGRPAAAIPGSGYPKLAGQHATYTANQLLAYKSGERKSDADQNQVMRNIAEINGRRRNQGCRFLCPGTAIRPARAGMPRLKAMAKETAA